MERVYELVKGFPVIGCPMKDAYLRMPLIFHVTYHPKASDSKFEYVKKIIIAAAVLRAVITLGKAWNVYVT